MPRGGLGNRLRFLESVLASSEQDKKIIIWSVDKSCNIDPIHYFDFTLNNATFYLVPKYLMPTFYFFLLSLMIFFPKKVSFNKRKYLPNVWFESSPHAYEGINGRFTKIQFSKNSRKIWNRLKLDHQVLMNLYDVVYLRGTDNKSAIMQTDYRSIFAIIEQAGSRGTGVVGVTDDYIFQHILSSYDAYLLRDTIPQRGKVSAVEQTIEDLLVLAHAKTISSSAYSSFAELAIRLSEKTKLDIHSKI